MVLSLKSNKKGNVFVQTLQLFTYHLPFLVLLSLFLLFYALIVSNISDKLNPVPTELEIDIFTARMLNVCFAKEDSFGNLQSNILDEYKLNNEFLSNCFVSYKEKPIRVTIQNNKINVLEKPIILSSPYFSKTKVSIQRSSLLYSKGKLYPILIKVEM